MVCRLYYKVDKITSSAISAKWCMIEYMSLLETLAIIARCSLDANYNLGFMLYVLFLY